MPRDSDPADDLKFHSLPVNFYQFSDGLFIRRATDSHTDVLGWKVVRIGGLAAGASGTERSCCLQAVELRTGPSLQGASKHVHHLGPRQAATGSVVVVLVSLSRSATSRVGLRDQ